MTVQTGISGSPDFLLHFETCPSCVSVSLGKHTRMEGGHGRGPPGETEQSRNAAAGFHQHVEEAETTPEMWCEDNRSPLERTLRKHAAAQVTGTGDGRGQPALSSAPHKGSNLGNTMGCHPGTHVINTRGFHQKMFLLLLFFGVSS